HQGPWPSAGGYIYSTLAVESLRILTHSENLCFTRTDLSVGAPAGTQPPFASPGSERSNAGRGHSSDQVRSEIKQQILILSAIGYNL
ncbi:hypothetical protein A2U01_0068692, partial [Trifolium medium]|nr:hypothetical protein [Trifolium medium]